MREKTLHCQRWKEPQESSGSGLFREERGPGWQEVDALTLEKQHKKELCSHDLRARRQNSKRAISRLSHGEQMRSALPKHRQSLECK